MDGDDFAPFALLELDYLAQTDLRGDLPGGSVQPITITAGPQAGPGGEEVGKVTQMTLEVSYDDGLTWQKVSLAGNGGSWAGSLKLPRKAGFVSVRASAVTDAGYSIKQEVIRAYGVDRSNVRGRGLRVPPRSRHSIITGRSGGVPPCRSGFVSCGPC